MKLLNDHVAIVTGGGTGAGAAVARLLGQHGVRVAVNDINPDRAETTAIKIREAGGEAIAIGADIANKFQCVHLVETTRAEWGRLDILINHAAVQPSSTIIKLDEWDWQRCLDVNLKGTFFMSQLVGRVMADENAGRGGTIVNLSHAAGFVQAAVNKAAFCASQAGIVGFARECAREYAAYDIAVHTVLADADPDQQQLTAALLPPAVQNWLQNNTHSYTNPVTLIADMTIHLCTQMWGDMSGTVLPVDTSRIIG